MRQTLNMTLLVALLLVGCNATRPLDVQPERPVVADTFNAAECAAELAHQAELANKSPAFLASDVLDGILNQGPDCGMPQDFIERVRRACPAIGAEKATDLSESQVAVIKAVR